MPHESEYSPRKLARSAKAAGFLLRKKLSGGRPTRQGRTYDEIIEEESVGRRRSAQSTDDAN